MCPLIVASAMGFLEIVQLLIQHGADLEQVMGARRTAIHLAAAEGHLDVVMCLITNGEKTRMNQTYQTITEYFSVI